MSIKCCYPVSFTPESGPRIQNSDSISSDSSPYVVDTYILEHVYTYTLLKNLGAECPLHCPWILPFTEIPTSPLFRSRPWLNFGYNVSQMPLLTTTIEDNSPLITYTSGWRAGSSSSDTLLDQFVRLFRLSCSFSVLVFSRMFSFPLGTQRLHSL